VKVYLGTLWDTFGHVLLFMSQQEARFYSYFATQPESHDGAFLLLLLLFDQGRLDPEGCLPSGDL